MQAKWLICNLGKDEQIQALFYGVQEAGREAQMITLGDAAEIMETVSDEKACIITSGSIWLNKELKKARPNWIGNFHNQDTFRCTSYYPFWRKYLTQKKYTYLTLDVIFRDPSQLYKKYGKNDQIFIRPDSGEKEFNGELVHKDRFTAWMEDVKIRLSYANLIAEKLLCIVSQPVEIDKEYRLVIADGKVVTGSTYRVAKHIAHEDLTQDELSLVTEFVHKVLNDGPPPLPPFFVLDIAKESDGTFSILEVGCFCCCGLYAADRKKVAIAISESAEKAFSEQNRIQEA